MVRSCVVAVLTGVFAWGCGGAKEELPEPAKHTTASPPMTTPLPSPPPPSSPPPSSPPALDGLTAPLPELPPLQELPCLTPDGSEVYAGLQEPAGGWLAPGCDDVRAAAPAVPATFGFTETPACLDELRPATARACEVQTRSDSTPDLLEFEQRDAEGRTIARRQLRGGQLISSERFAHDESGRLVREESRSRTQIRVTEWRYDATGRIAWRRHAVSPLTPYGLGGGVEQLQYFCDGRPARIVATGDHAVGNAGSFFYDDKGRLTREPRQGGSLEYGYDAAGALRIQSGSGYFWHESKWHDETGFVHRSWSGSTQTSELCLEPAAPDVAWHQWPGCTAEADCWAGYIRAPKRADGTVPLQWSAFWVPTWVLGTSERLILQQSVRRTHTCAGELVAEEALAEYRHPRTGTVEQWTSSDLRREVLEDGSVLERRTFPRENGQRGWIEKHYRFDCSVP